MRISIAMATYNGARYLEEQLDSFLYQSQQPDELVACDDASTDETVSILQSFRRRAPFEVIIHRNAKKLGHVRNFERAMSLSSGDIVLLSDQDDVWFPNKIMQVALAFQKELSVWVVVNNAEITDGGLVPTGLSVAGQLGSAGLGTDSLFLGCCMAFRRELKSLLLPLPSEIHGHDSWINLLGSTLRCRQFIPEILQAYRRHDGNTSTWPTWSLRRAGRWAILKEQLRWSNIRCDPLAASGTRLQTLAVLKDRILDHAEYLRMTLPSPVPLHVILDSIESEIRANEMRQSIQQRRIHIRLVLGLRFYVSGGYRYFEGWKSLARDLVR